MRITQRSPEQSYEALRVKRVCNNSFKKSLIYRHFRHLYHYQRDRQLSANKKIYQSSRMLAFVELLLYLLVQGTQADNVGNSKGKRASSSLLEYGSFCVFAIP